jgi:hypothetical protein
MAWNAELAAFASVEEISPVHFARADTLQGRLLGRNFHIDQVDVLERLCKFSGGPGLESQDVGNITGEPLSINSVGHQWSRLRGDGPA